MMVMNFIGRPYSLRIFQITNNSAEKFFLKKNVFYFVVLKQRNVLFK